jgi:tetratricopeptide (TPR) repeat protein
MSDVDVPATRRWHWAESDHWEIRFHGLPRRFPWPDSDPPPPSTSYPNSAGKEFPILRVYHAVEALLAQQTDTAPDPRFVAFARVIEAGEEFASAMERGDLIAAEGVTRQWDLTGLDCAYVVFNKAFIYKQTGRVAEARALYRRATELSPDSEMLWMLYATVSEEAGDRAEAVRACHEARRLLPNHREATLMLERLKELFRVTLPENRNQSVWLSKPELRTLSEKDLAQHWNDAKGLRAWAGQILHDNLFPDLGLRALDRSLELEPTNAEAQRNRGVALLRTGRADEALAALKQALELDQGNAWTRYHLAQAYVEKNDIDSAWRELGAALDIDPNHSGALELKYLRRDDRTAEQKEQDLVEFSRPREDWTGAWRGYLLAANSAWKRDARQAAVGHAADAYKIAPDDEEVFLTYTGMLGECGEYEWVAALTKPRLRAGETSSRAFMNFARALHALGLAEEAVATLRRALAELTLTPEERAGITGKLDEWTERFAIGEVQAELHCAGVLRRNICQVRDGKVLARWFENGMGLPHDRTIPVGFKTPKSEFDVTLEQRHTFDDPAPETLGTFTISEIDPARLADEKVTLQAHLNEAGDLSVGAKQGDRKLRVTWSLYPPPRIEP